MAIKIRRLEDQENLLSTPGTYVKFFPTVIHQILKNTIVIVYLDNDIGDK